ncbi:hypothetical protein PFLmoz3_00028 [Pseudomonas fluorescens]|uniref:Uncharacterized protein n=1 Tax=Pseudomonas fluorescens TaxID=294 RepID=A0A125QJB9_PSEFL|nr:hypothetical protein PFLmoz3_00028 [Pseudomonas fluorescens]
MLGDQIELDRLPGQAVEFAVIRLRARAPETGTADVGQARAEVVAEQAEQPKHHIAVGPGVGHDLRRLQLGLLFQHHGQQHQAVAQGAGHGDGVEAGELIGNQVVPGDAPAGAEILRVGASMHGAHRYHEAHAIGGGDLAAAPDLGQLQLALRPHQNGVCH